MSNCITKLATWCVCVTASLSVYQKSFLLGVWITVLSPLGLGFLMTDMLGCGTCTNPRWERNLPISVVAGPAINDTVALDTGSGASNRSMTQSRPNPWANRSSRVRQPRHIEAMSDDANLGF
ncbi:hypothetical protein B0T18DRAFT_87052 [Schizothecium vesticola]|uniref:Uncharacterized protein n=1 Tax=Schizothecium vesticola TaxID=314040 RepID=A0AA40F6P3_9PEZI|nr:hypothetical protein B0T18DRAFT_87052 [Schizothecium vesticola]